MSTPPRHEVLCLEGCNITDDKHTSWQSAKDRAQEHREKLGHGTVITPIEDNDSRT